MNDHDVVTFPGSPLPAPNDIGPLPVTDVDVTGWDLARAYVCEWLDLEIADFDPSDVQTIRLQAFYDWLTAVANPREEDY